MKWEYLLHHLMKIPRILIILIILETRLFLHSIIFQSLLTIFKKINLFFPSKEIIVPISDSNDFQSSFVWNSREKPLTNEQARTVFSIDHNPAWNQYPRTAKSRGISVIEITSSSLSISLFLPLSLPAECWKSGAMNVQHLSSLLLLFSLKAEIKWGTCFRIALTTVLHEPDQMDRFTWHFVVIAK